MFGMLAFWLGISGSGISAVGLKIFWAIFRQRTPNTKSCELASKLLKGGYIVDYIGFVLSGLLRGIQGV